MEAAAHLTARQRSSNAYKWSIVGLGVLALVDTAMRLPLPQLDLRFVILAAAMVLVSSRLSVQIPRINTNVTVSDGILNIQSIAGAADSPVLSALQVVASGGGGTTGTTGTPTVTATVPADGASSVSTAIAPAATFSTTMDATTIDGTSFTLKDSLNNPVPATVTYDAATKKATLTPGGTGLKGSTTYTASLAGTIKGSDATPLALERGF